MHVQFPWLKLWLHYEHDQDDQMVLLMDLLLCQGVRRLFCLEQLLQPLNKNYFNKIN
jgi:hypothetical protein